MQALVKTTQDDAGLCQKLLAPFGADLNGKRFALWCLAFKANTDDMCKATSRDLIAEHWALTPSPSGRGQG